MMDNFKVTCRVVKGRAGTYDIAAWHREEDDDGKTSPWTLLRVRRIFIDPSVYTDRQLLGRLARSLVA